MVCDEMEPVQIDLEQWIAGEEPVPEDREKALVNAIGMTHTLRHSTPAANQLIMKALGGPEDLRPLENWTHLMAIIPSGGLFRLGNDSGYPGIVFCELVIGEDDFYGRAHDPFFALTVTVMEWHLSALLEKQDD